MRKRKKELLDALPYLEKCEEEDIVCSMKDEADFSIQWIKDNLLDREKKSTGGKLCKITRRKIHLKAYWIYLELQFKIRRQVKKAANDLLGGFDSW